jgi:hypothetical protein
MAKKKTCCSGEMKDYVIPEVAFYAATYYLLYVLQVPGSIWLKSLVLFVLINVAIMTCPMMKACMKK